MLLQLIMSTPVCRGSRAEASHVHLDGRKVTSFSFKAA